MKLKTGDNVIVIAGKEKGKSGKIIRVLPGKNKVVIDGLNQVNRHQKPRRSNEKGTMLKLSMPINASNVMLKDPKSGKGTRIGTKLVGDKKVRIARKSNQEV